VTISDFKAEAVGTNIYLTWTTNIPSHTRARYSQNPLLLDEKKETPELVTSHNLTLSDMPANSNITLMAESCDSAGSCANTTAVTVETTEKIELTLAVDGMDCNPSTASYSNSERMDVKGAASPGAELNVYVNGARKRAKRITSTGTFNFVGLSLDTRREANEIRITAADQVAPDKECLEKVLLDRHAPDVEFSNETKNLVVTTDENVQLKGNVTDNTDVTLYIYLQSVDDTIPPPAPENLTEKAVEANSITISWAPYGEAIDDVYKYLIYRSDVPDGPIAMTEPTVTEFQDSNVSTYTTYTYQISAVDKAGNEGLKCSPYSMTTLPNGTTAGPVSKITPDNPGLILTKEFRPNNNTLQFTESVGPLFEGRNIVTLKFVDLAGNEQEERFELIFDSEPPAILTPTSGEFGTLYSPTYMSSILVTGQINKPTGEVWIWTDPSFTSLETTTTGSLMTGDFQVNVPEEPDMKIAVGENGTFEAEIELTTTTGAAVAGAFSGSRGTGTTTGEDSVTVVGEQGKQNKVVMVAVDAYGRVSAPVESNIEYTPCGSQQYWSVKLKQGSNVINTRELLEGIAVYGFGYELEWIGGGDAMTAFAQNVRLKKAQVGALEKEKYDFEWVTSEPRVLPSMTQGRRDFSKGFIMVNFAPQNPEGETYLAKEQNLSRHRKGECWPLNGCIRLLLQMEIDSSQTPLMGQPGVMPQQQFMGGSPYPSGPQYPGSPQAGGMYANIPGGRYAGGSQYADARFGTMQQGISGASSTIGTQKQCIELKIMLDERIDFASSDLVKKILASSVAAINATLEVIDLIEKPLKYITYITMGVCLLSTVAKIVVGTMERLDCKLNANLKKIAKLAKGKGGIRYDIDKIASMHNSNAGGEGGACNIEFQDEDEEDMKSACLSCAKAKEKLRSINSKWHFVCDRVGMCPSVPSLQHYINSKYTRGRKSQPSSTADRPERVTACTPFNPNTDKGGQRISAKCTYKDADGEEKYCGPSTSSISYIWAGGTNCIDVQPPCTGGKVDQDYCRCGEQVCVETQECELPAGTCTKRVAGWKPPTLGTAQRVILLFL
jgi:hypothetical protein